VLIVDVFNEGAILHGLCTYNIAAVQILRAFGGSDPVNFKSFEARFSSPVLPGGMHVNDLLTIDELETLMWEMGKTVDGVKEIIFETRVNGKPVLGNGRALIRGSNHQARL
jgi:peroxisomal enoyl-CoA hydratase 2